jgi:hypothetical protein
VLRTTRGADFLHGSESLSPRSQQIQTSFVSEQRCEEPLESELLSPEQRLYLIELQRVLTETEQGETD